MQMKKELILSIILSTSALVSINAQNYNQMDENGNITTRNENGRNNKTDSLGSDKEIPKGLKVWNIDSRFGDRIDAVPDTVSYMYMNSIFTSGLRSEYNTTGNLGSPRVNRIFTDRFIGNQFIFTDPYDYFITPVDKFQFTNTLSPITNISYDNCGNRTNGEDHFKALFAVNSGKKIGLGFKFDYLYGRGYYSNQSTSHFNGSIYASYIGDRYDMHFLFSSNHEKVSENGGITDDNYITHPESFNDNFGENEIPTVLEQNWNRNDNQHIFLSHRYNVGFNRKVRMTDEEIKAKKFAIESAKENKDKDKGKNKSGKNLNQNNNDQEKPKVLTGRPLDAKIAGDEPSDSTKKVNGRIIVNGKSQSDSLIAASKKAEQDTSWLKNEYVPVTSFIHTLDFNNYSRIYEAYNTPTNYYANTYYKDGILSGDSIYDKTKFYSIKNTFAIALLEGFNKYAKAGLKVFGSHEYRNISMPDDTGMGTTSWGEHDISVGGQISKTQGNLLHYNILAETWLVGKDAGQLKIDGKADLNFKFLNDTVQLAAKAYLYRLNPTFFYRHYQSKHLWWDNDGLDKEIRTHIEGDFSLKRTRTHLRIAVDDIQNYTYFAQAYTITSSFGRTGNTVTVNQSSENISLITAQLSQDFTLGPLNWENQVTYQKSTNNNILPVPDVNIYSNLYLRFMISHVLKVDLGGDVRYFTKYYAPDYSPALGQYCVQNGENRMEVGNCPIVNIYANMHLKHTRFFVMMSHVAGGNDYFFTPHYPLNGRVFRFGVSWNFFN